MTLMKNKFSPKIFVGGALLSALVASGITQFGDFGSLKLAFELISSIAGGLAALFVFAND